jgi:acyl dehydratase
MTKLSDLTGKDNYFENFTVGQVFKHARGKTVEPLENVLITNMVMNTAQAHFNEHVMQQNPMRMATVIAERVSYGGVNFSLVMGLAMQDTGENALAELGLDNIRLMTPVLHGDTLYAYSEVLAVKDSDRADAGEVTFRHYGTNQRDEQVFQGDRRVLLKRRSHWGDR